MDRVNAFYLCRFRPIGLYYTPESILIHLKILISYGILEYNGIWDGLNPLPQTIQLCGHISSTPFVGSKQGDWTKIHETSSAPTSNELEGCASYIDTLFVHTHFRELESSIIKSYAVLVSVDKGIIRLEKCLGGNQGGEAGVGWGH
jgi:hypothetical protein